MSEWLNRVHFGDCMETLRRMPDGIVNTCVTSPPYFGLRDYGHPGQIGMEATPDEFVRRLVEVFREVRRVLRDDGTCWVNMGDSYAGSGRGGNSEAITGSGKDESRKARGSTLPAGLHAGQVEAKAVGRAWVPPPAGLKQKDLIGVPWMLAFALRADGWYLRQDIIWSKPNPMPESVTDRCTKAHEYIFLLSKSRSYYCDMEAVKEEAAPASVARWDQDVDSQQGSARVPGKTNGTMKAAGGPRAKRDSFKRDDSKRGDAIPGQRVGTHRPDREESEWETERRNRRSVWTVSTKPYSGAHFATFPENLIEPCILAGAPAGGVVLDPFMGSGTTASVATRLGRQWIGCELNPDYEPLQRERLVGQTLGLELA
jgi:DNA modification methylase